MAGHHLVSMAQERGAPVFRRLRRSAAGGVLACLGLMPAAAADTIEAPAGWSVSQQGAEVVLTQGQMILRVFPWAMRGGDSFERWTKRQANKPSEGVKVKKIGKVTVVTETPWNISAIEATAVVSRNLRNGGGMGAMMVTCVNDLRMRAISAYGPGPEFQTGGRILPAMLNSKLIPSVCQSPPPLEAAPPRADTDVSFAAPPSWPKPLAGLWYVGKFVAGVSGAEARQSAIAAFQDGSVYRKPGALLSLDGAAPPQEQKYWGQWRAEGDVDIEVKWSGKSNYDDYFTSVRLPPLPEDARIDGCYSSSQGYTLGFGAQTASMSVNTWCFGRNGRFSNDRALSLSGTAGSTVSTGSASSGVAGSYRIDGNIIQFVYDDGRRHVTSFGQTNPKDWRKDVKILIGSGAFD